MQSKYLQQIEEESIFLLTILSLIHVSLAQDQNQFIYNGFQGANLHLDGAAKILPSGLLELTNTSKQIKGHAFYQIPISFNRSSSISIPFPSFSTNLAFAIVPELPNLSGHGLAFIISPTMDFSQAVGGQYLGLFNISNNGLPTNHVLAIELDTILNPEFADINNNHVGIDVNSLKSVDSAPVSYFSSEEGKNISLRLLNGDPMQLWVDYDAPREVLNVTVAPLRRLKPNRPLLSTPVDLSQFLLENMYVGFSSATGPVASDHYVLGWSFNSSGPAQNLEISKLPPLPPKRKTSQKPTVYFVRRKKYAEVREEWETEYDPQRFSYKDLYIATKGFKEKELLGAGGFGKVYKGTLPASDVQIAVKRISHDSHQGMKEFVAEIASMRRLRHRNLVQLLGYCRRKGELLLVYDYMPNGSLDKFLFSNRTPTLSWFHRFRVLKDVASALLYLHEEWEQVVLHRDVKSSNVLLDADLSGSLEILALLDYTTMVPILKPLVWSGRFMLEMACGRRPMDLQGLPEEVSMVDWVMGYWRCGAILDVIDPKLEGTYLVEEMELVLKLGLLCAHPMPAMRPKMRQVMQYLDGHVSLPEIQDGGTVFTSTFAPSNGASDFVMSFPSLSGKCSANLLSTHQHFKEPKGSCFYKIPLSFNSSSSALIPFPSFSTNFAFAMVPEFPYLSGHGMAFTISPSMDFSQAVATRYLGLFNFTDIGLPTNHVFAIELDTIENPEFEDIDDNHVGIDVNSLKSVKSAPASYFSGAEGKNISLKLINGEPMQLWIDYNAPQKTLNVTLAPLRSQKPNRPLLSTAIDLSQFLLEKMYVGFASATGSVASNHYVLGWSFNKSGPAQNLEISKLPPVPSHKKRSQNPTKIIMKYEEVREEWETEYGPHRFSYKDLYVATKGFKETQLLGAGGFGKVYEGTLPNSDLQIAVKKVSHDSKQGMKEFVAEIASMGRLRHRNLVQLLGYCRRKGELHLVYDYMSNGSLDKFLFSNEKPNLSWLHRFRVIKGVASALLYLHEEWEQVVLHRDVKASNVLLDADLNGRLGDFGLARLYDHGTNPQTTHVVGTVGYLAPELTRTGKATTKTDVFAFGAFMLEVACGRRPIHLQGQTEELILVDFVLECWKRGAILDASDQNLEGNYLAEEMELVLKLGLLCSHSIPAMRPDMRQVMQYLDGITSLPEIQTDIGVLRVCLQVMKHLNL
ncbi:hypothetical protein FNV43_RR13165 [Rhamnella rubrinervis]|uniref:non-specific serine/threonine protein kinase n=1 Tax=Rhamnella rubrinervis TaxID=2594499 RepID=A0A8K0MEY8_9ROSA|nr:hypothetical protein FNV43_RR13165 [Rhamnella rubrinervis]